MSREHLFEGDLFWTGQANEVDGRLHLARSYDLAFTGKEPLPGSSPAAFRGDERRHNPETLMVSSLMACHHLSYMALCERAGIRVAAYSDHGIGRLAIRDGRMRMVDLLLRPRVRIAEPAEVERALALHAQAHASCFMSNSVNFEVRVEPSVTA